MLLREGDKLSSLDLVGTFERTGCSECVARAAATLVFDRGDSACFDPVDYIAVA